MGYLTFVPPGRRHDHVEWDATLLARFAGEDIDVEAHLPSDVICDAAAVAQEQVRDLLRSGWRPPWAGPTRDELVDLMMAV